MTIDRATDALGVGRDAKHGTARAILSSTGARMAVLPLTGVCSILTARLVIDTYGVDGYAIFSLIAALPFLFPFIDLGVGAAVANAAGALPDRWHEYRETLTRARRVLFLVSGTILVAIIGIAVVGGWPTLTGLPGSATVNWGIAGAMLLFAVAIPGSLGHSMLFGMRKNSWSVWIQGLGPPVTLALVLGASLWAPTIFAALVATTAGVLVSSWTATVVASRVGIVRAARRAAPVTARSSNPVALWATAWPMLVVSLSLPLSFQTGRLVLSWQATLGEVAVYSAAMITFLPVFSIAQVAGQSLWGEFAGARARAESGAAEYLTGLRIVACVGLIGAVGLVSLGPILSGLAVNYAVHFPPELFWILGATVLVQALYIPSGMYLTDAPGLRFQALLTVLMGVFVLVASVLTAEPLGVTGVALSLLCGIIFFQLVPGTIRVRFVIRRHMRAGLG
ncbi:lipopolysaccharide biosynthesis protein [Mycetocola zhadangensis]|uniref:lipopolysaccharide biosynthesis protein n=1 Tax=Mycetocola zhadangensis TaxID=1164595 RepID=UPI003A4D7747